MKSRRRTVFNALGSILAAASLLLAATIAPLHAGGSKSLRGRQKLSAGGSAFLPPAGKAPVVPWSSQAKPDINAAIRAASTDPKQPPPDEPPPIGQIGPQQPLAAFGGAPQQDGGDPALRRPTVHPYVARILTHVHRDLAAMGEVLGAQDDPRLRQYAEVADEIFLGKINPKLLGGTIQPWHGIRLSEEDTPKPVVDRTLNIAVNPMAGDPPTWGHLHVMGQALGNDRFPVDNVVAMPAGNDPVRKPNMTPAEVRHPINQAVMAPFDPLIRYSPIAMKTRADGEENVFKLLSLNPAQRIHVFYMAGEDHYKDNDTIAKLEGNMRDPRLGFNPNAHRISVVFTERLEAGKEAPKKALEERIRDKEVRTSLDVLALPRMRFLSSSTAVRKEGALHLLPYTAYEYVVKRRLGLWGIPADGSR